MSVVIDGSSGITTNSGTVVSTTDATLNGLTVGKGGGSVSTNTAVGASALNATNTGGKCTAFGYQALTLTTGKENTAVGSGAGASMTSGEGLAAFGWNAANLNTADNVTALGHNTLGSNTTGANNTAVGNAALNVNTTGSYNTAIGRTALVANTTGSGNIAIGYQAGNLLATGSYNIYMGYQTGNNTKTSGVDCIYIGRTITPNNATVNGEMVINTNGNNVTGKGDGTGLITTGGNLYNGLNTSAWQTISDRRLKKNIVDNTEGLDVISQIKVRNFEYKLPEEITELQAQDAIQKTGVQLGVIAQELQEVCPDCIKQESSGVLSVNSDNLTWHMINAIKDLKALVYAQATEIAELKAKVT